MHPGEWRCEYCKYLVSSRVGARHKRVSGAAGRHCATPCGAWDPQGAEAPSWSPALGANELPEAALLLCERSVEGPPRNLPGARRPPAPLAPSRELYCHCQSGCPPGGPQAVPSPGGGRRRREGGGAGVRGERQGGGTGWSESSGGARGFRAGRSQGLSRARWLPVQCSLLASPAGKGESSAPRSAPQQHRLCLAPGRCLLSPRPSSVTPTLHPVHQQDAHCPASRCCRAHTSHLGRGSERAGVMVEHGVTRQLMTIGRGSRAPLHWLRTRCAHCRRMWLPGLRQPWDSGGRVA